MVDLACYRGTPNPNCDLSSPGVVDNQHVLVLGDFASFVAVEFKNDITLFLVGE